MAFKTPFSYQQIEPKLLNLEVQRRGLYYTNVVCWTLIFTLPFSMILDFLFLDDTWQMIWGGRIAIAIICYLFYKTGIRKKRPYQQTLHVSVGLFMTLGAIVAATAPNDVKIAYFLLLSIFILLINTTVFWPASFSLLHILFNIVIILYVYLTENTLDSINILIKDGAGMYFIVALFSCLIASNRYPLIKRNIERRIVIKRSNELLLEQNEQINEQRIALEQANRELKQMSTFRSDTLRIIIHDIRSFTSSVTMILDVMQDEVNNMNSEVKEGLQHIEEANKKLNHFAQTLVEATRQGQSGKIAFAVNSFDINKEILKTLQNLTTNIIVNDIQLHTSLTEEPLLVKLDQVFAGQAIFKLLSNAFHFAQRGAEIHVRSFLQGGNTTVIEIQDMSIPPIGLDNLTHMFNELQEGEAVPDKRGFGFSVSKRLVESMGGTLQYDSSEEGGNYYRIEFANA